MKKMILSVTLVTLLTLFSTTISATAVTMYATDGRTAEVDSTKIAAYKNAGWYENKADAFTLLYTTDGRIKYVPNDNVSKHINLGWQKKYTELN